MAKKKKKDEKKPVFSAENVVQIAGGDGMPPEPHWPHYYDEADKRERAHRNWMEICNALRDAGGLAVSNGHAILRLISLRLEYDASVQDVAARGVIIPETRKRVAHTNPHFRAMRQMDETIRQLETALGIAPTVRGRIGKVQRKQAKNRAADAYIGAKAND